MKKKVALLICELGLILSLLLACNAQREPIECIQIQEEALRSLKYGTMDLVYVRQWFERSSPFKGAHVDTSNNAVEKLAIWEKNDVRYYAYFRNDILVRVEVLWESQSRAPLKPIGNEILRCFGEPDLYQASYLPDVETWRFNLALWYLKEGVIVQASDFSHKIEPPAIDGNVIMTDMTITTPGNVEEMIKNVYGSNRNIREEILKTLKPWPGGWEKIVIATKPVGD